MRSLIYGLSFMLLFSCNGEEGSATKVQGTTKNPVPDEQLNITILLDLSDRLTQEVQPSPAERDIAIVSNLVEVFKSEMVKKGAYLAKGKIRVLFDPSPADPNINKIANRLSVDLSEMDNKQKKHVHDNIKQEFEEGLKEIYDLTLKSKNWVGSDTWRFFKYSASELCIDIDEDYRNLLVVITDGYVYHKHSISKEGNRTSYLTGIFLEREGLRKTPDWLAKFEAGDYGFIDTKQHLENLEVLVLEINPSTRHLNDEDILRKYLGKWFDEMSVKDYKIYNTDLPLNTKKRIDNFFHASLP